MKTKLLLHLYVVIGALAYVYILNITKIGCPFRYILKFPSPTCGMTRSFISLLKLDFYQSFVYHPMTVPLLIALFLAFHKKLFPGKTKFINIFVIAVAVLIFVVYIYRLSYNLIP